MSKFTDELAAFIREKKYNVFSIAEFRGDALSFADLARTNHCQNVYSCAKAFTMTAIGLLYDRSLLSPEDRVCDLLREFVPESGMDPRWENVTVDWLLRHRAGLPGGFLDIDCNPSSLFGRDYLHYTFTYPLAYEPGTEERYSDGAYYMLARIAEALTGKGMDDFLWEELFFRMGFQEVAFSHCPLGHVIGATGMYVHASDMVKLGKLYLDNGLYNGERLLSEEWIRLAVERSYCFDTDESGDFYYKGGMNGQKLYVFPKQNRAVAVESFGADTGTIAKWIAAYRDD